MTHWIKKTSIWNTIPGLLTALSDCISRNLSSKQASEELSELSGRKITRNAVIGRARRAGEHFKSETDGQYHRKATATRKAKREVPYNFGRVRAAPVALPAEPVKQPNFLCITFADLEQGQCKFPHGDDPLTMTYCGQPAVNDGPWCSYHKKICTVQGSNQWRPESNSIFRTIA